jgi:hypothetical protein
MVQIKQNFKTLHKIWLEKKYTTYGDLFLVLMALWVNHLLKVNIYYMSLLMIFIILWNPLEVMKFKKIEDEATKKARKLLRLLTIASFYLSFVVLWYILHVPPLNWEMWALTLQYLFLVTQFLVITDTDVIVEVFGLLELM